MPWDGMQSWFTDFVSGSISKNHLEHGDDTAFRGNTVRYKDVTNRLVVAPTFTIHRNAALGTGSVLVDMLSMQQRPR